MYVCGDATRMAHDVDKALTNICITHGTMSHTEACEYLSWMSRDGRYQKDVWVI